LKTTMKHPPAHLPQLLLRSFRKASKSSQWRICFRGKSTGYPHCG
jgi:hypothetical protein